MQFGWVIGIGSSLALGLSVVSLALTHHIVLEEKQRDTRPLELAAEGVQSELDRLHSRYVDQLEGLVEEVKRSRGNTFGPGLTAANIVGVRTITVMSLSEGEKPIHFEVLERADEEPAFDKERFPLLAFGESAEKEEGARLLDRNRFADSSISSGWVREPGDAFYFWKRIQPATIALVGVDALSFRAAVNRWLPEKEDLAIQQMQSGVGEFVRFAGPDGSSLLVFGIPPEDKRSPANFPATIRFGTWQIQSWNAVEKTSHWNTPFLIAGQVLALMVLIAAVLVGIALRRATRLAERRVSFVNSASHELRSPITNMMLNVDLARDLTEENPAAANQRLDRVKEEAGRLSRLVDNLLTFSKSGKSTDSLHKESVDPDEILQETLDQFAALLGRREIAVEWAKGEQIILKADPDALSRIFGNLLSNVEKYAAEGKRLIISTRIIEDVWSADFADKGPGVSPKFAGRIFEPFRRSSDRINEGVSGTGLGLTISRELAFRHGGDLIFVPNSDGAVFRLTIPVSDS